MKLTWGRKISCPACLGHFYDMQKVALTCPSCGNVFKRAELFSRKNTQHVATEVIEIDDDGLNLSDFGFEENESIDIDVSDDSAELSAKTELDDVSLIDEE